MGAALGEDPPVRGAVIPLIDAEAHGYRGDPLGTPPPHARRAGRPPYFWQEQLSSVVCHRCCERIPALADIV